ncbi:PREDICTED: box C/D snoRNA protein 1 [Polistes dominula]|uniref:Box C/D snoRNA protein 1 n=1 Tax=Polistes dominula TaxID=743375 RepID=A0ABM1IAR3_POLDO|nr:PREDICTED: box C/D snoRNA protein 1 [Polistes dominula]
MAAPYEKLENCEVCNANKAKYTCPKCEVRTCCLTCVNIHKKELECDGIRDRMKFKTLDKFTDLDLLNDYRLLEEIGRSVDQAKYNPLKRFSRYSELPMHLNRLRKGAYSRKVNLRFMPQHFTRHIKNTTFFKWNTNQIFWRIEWIFPQADNIVQITERALETVRLSTLLEQVLYPLNGTEETSNIEELNSKLSLNNKLQFYQAADFSGLKVLLKTEQIEKSNTRYHELDVSLTLKENLENKTVIEFPILYVVLQHHIDMYEIVDTDDEEIFPKKKLERKNKWSSADKDNNKKQKTNEPVNYFFNTTTIESDEELDTPSDKQQDRGHNRTQSNFDIPKYEELINTEQ